MCQRPLSRNPRSRGNRQVEARKSQCGSIGKYRYGVCTQCRGANDRNGFRESETVGVDLHVLKNRIRKHDVKLGMTNLLFDHRLCVAGITSYRRDPTFLNLLQARRGSAQSRAPDGWGNRSQSLHSPAQVDDVHIGKVGEERYGLLPASRPRALTQRDWRLDE